MSEQPDKLANGEEFVKTPVGWRPASLVQRVPSGVKLNVDEAGELTAVQKDGTPHELGKASPEAMEWLNHPDHPERLQGGLENGGR